MENENGLKKSRYEWKRWLGWYEKSVAYFAENGLDHEEDRFIPYPLQMANGVRIMTNDAVFIFDEVGCGKTISAGIMAETFLYNREEGMQPAEILVITTNTVKRLRQFQNDWKKIYPGLDRRVTVWNNLSNSDLKFLNEDKKWGMVIIDEAHEFCNTDTQKYNALKNKLRAEKVVFLTATPLRGGKNFEFYKELCRSILEKIPTGMGALDELDNTGKKPDPSQLICAKFDPECPVTRFFKDTNRFLNVHEEKVNAHRVIPEIWEFDHSKDSRKNRLVKGITDKLRDNEKNKFIIFVRTKKEADKIRAVLVDCQEQRLTEKNVAVVFAENKEVLEKYSSADLDNLPTVLIMNYQIGEAGVNLPGYNHVIHWYISADPARLEQRYGRIDRLTSKYDKLYSIFVDVDDSRNLNNFLSAVAFTMEELFTSLPARNVLLTKEALTYYRNIFEKEKEKIDQERKFLEAVIVFDGEARNILYEELCRVCEKRQITSPLSSKTSLSQDDFDKICNFLEECVDREKIEEALAFDNGNIEDVEAFWESMKKTIERRIKDFVSRPENFDGCISRIENNADMIFYLTEKKDPGSLQIIGAQGEYTDAETGNTRKGCASYIEEMDEYKVICEVIKAYEMSGLTKAKNINFTERNGEYK